MLLANLCRIEKKHFALIHWKSRHYQKNVTVINTISYVSFFGFGISGNDVLVCISAFINTFADLLDLSIIQYYDKHNKNKKKYARNMKITIV